MDESEGIDTSSQHFQTGHFGDEELFELYQSNPELFQQLLQQHYEQMQQNYSVYQECVLPVLTQSYETMGNLVLFCLLLRILSLLRIPRTIFNMLSLSLGFVAIWQFYQYSGFYVVLPVLIASISYQSSNIGKRFYVFFCAIYILACEMFLDAIVWNKLKGSVMIVFMKILSIVFDELQLDSIELFGYLFNPASVIFGPFILHKDYAQLFSPQPLSFNWLFQTFFCFTVSCACLLWSSCGIPFYMNVVTTYLPLKEDNRWWIAYKDAQSFRFSHYFVSYFTEMCCLAMGIGLFYENVSVSNASDNDNNGKVHADGSSSTSGSFSWEKPVAHLLPVELPRSLVDVVTNWNLPMHFWLKKYVFKNTRHYGLFAAIFLTYIASSLLHGLNFQLSAILLSIGLFAYVEGVSRSFLAKAFNACIDARSCKDNCQHKHKKWNVMVLTTNMMFSTLAIWNLAYLGCVFDSSEGQELGYSMHHTLGKWRSYQFANHIFMFSFFILQRLVSSGKLF